MKIEEITVTLQQLFAADAIAHEEEDTWQITSEDIRLLIILSEDHSWLRMLAPIAPARDAQALLPQLLEANFEATGETRYALGQNVLWGVFYHRLESLTPADLTSAIAELITLAQQGLTTSFNQLIETRLHQIIQAAKLQGQDLETTLQTLDRFYQEGMLGGINQPAEEREKFLEAWRYQLRRLWSEVEVEEQ